MWAQHMASILLFHQGHLLQTCQCSELIRLSFTGTNFAGPPVYISYPYAVQCTTLDFSQNLESTNRYCMRRNFNVKSSTVKRLKKVVHAWLLFTKNIQIAVKTIQYLYSPVKRQIFSFSGVPKPKDGARFGHFVLFLNKKMNIFLAQVLKRNARGVKIFYF